MVTINKFLQELSKKQVQDISEKYLRGWVNLQSEYKIMLRGLNHRRDDYGLSRISRDQVFDYRDHYVKSHYSYEERVEQISNYLMKHKMDEQRGKGIFLFNCRFDVRYAKAFRSLIGKTKFDELSEKYRVLKMVTTQVNEYGGVGLASKTSLKHARHTTKMRYGVENPMQVDSFKNKLFKSMLLKLGDSMEQFRKTHDINVVKSATFNGSSTELFVLRMLCEKFGYDNVYYQYGVHPKDSRYPYNCDFYIKSLDLFIELNYYFSHGHHWFNAKNKDDQLRLRNLKLNHSNASYKRVLETWTKEDVNKRKLAKKNNLNYLVFWDYPLGTITDLKLSDLIDFNRWLVTYDGDYKKFVIDYPENTY